jgi:hypothetical protein
MRVDRASGLTDAHHFSAACQELLIKLSFQQGTTVPAQHLNALD